MTPQDVRSVLESFKSLRFTVGPLGFALRGCDLAFDSIPPARIERGSGIAGNGGRWCLVYDIGTGARSQAATTKRQLRRLVTEWLAGDRPSDLLSGFICYAKLNHNAQGDAYVWVVRRGPTGGGDGAP